MMLSPNEFIVGNIGIARPLSLVLPCDRYGETLLVGQLNEKTVAVFLSGQYQSSCFESEGNDNFKGIIIPNVRVELDEKSFVDPFSEDVQYLSLVRAGTQLAVKAKCNRAFGSSVQVMLHDNLESAGEYQVAFSRWLIVVGESQDKRVLWSNTDPSS